MTEKLNCINGHVNFYDNEGKQLGRSLPEKCILCFSTNRNRIVILEQVEKIIDEFTDGSNKFTMKIIKKRIGELK